MLLYYVPLHGLKRVFILIKLSRKAHRMFQKWAALIVTAVNKCGTSDSRLRYKGRAIRIQ